MFHDHENYALRHYNQIILLPIISSNLIIEFHIQDMNKTLKYAFKWSPVTLNYN